MKEEEQIRIAKWAIRKRLDYETLKWSDELYGRMSEVDEVWEYVVECEEIGTIAFQEKYGKI